MRDSGIRSSDLKPDDAAMFAGTARGQFIISQALIIAAEVLDNPRLPMKDRETSNAADMMYLAENLFTMFYPVKAARDRYMESNKKL